MRNSIFVRFLITLFVTPLFLYAQGNESFTKIGESSTESYVMYSDPNGNLFYLNSINHSLNLLKYELATATTTVIAPNFGDDTVLGFGFGAIAPTASGDTVYCLTAKSPAKIYRLICSQGKFEYLTSVCGSNWWMLFNLTLSKDGKSLFYVSNNNDYTAKAIRKIDVKTLACSEVLQLDDLIPYLDLCFGGINVWDKFGNFYAPVWDSSTPDGDLSIIKVHAEGANYSAKLIYFTDNGLIDGKPLFPGFRHNSCWSAIGASSKGNIYIAVSNHYQPASESDVHGNVAIYKYNPALDKISLLGDLKSTSMAVDNWMQFESQHKVHTFMMENSDGKMYFASDDYYPSHFLRGAHLYTIDVETDELTDYSKTQSYVLKKDFSVVENQNFASDTSGVFCQYYGIKGLALNPASPDYLYAMTYSNPSGVQASGNVIKYKIDKASASVLTSTDLQNKVSVYPNPFINNPVFDFRKLSDESPISLRIYNANGQIVFSESNCSNNLYTWNTTANIKTGIYFYSVSSKDGIYSSKIIKQ
ncbi:MAG: T9SS type A sorting domain-containing protein [Bacteroidales bacterium]|nr:T9SS type A sorting domain-containing protein [Bacteroidales bacterium]